jgi:hypothetical protein
MRTGFRERALQYGFAQSRGLCMGIRIATAAGDNFSSTDTISFERDLGQRYEGAGIEIFSNHT